jgi:hypothetical protein
LLRSAARVFGDPRGTIYYFHESERFLPSLLQLLKVVSRGLGRVGTKNDLNLLEVIKEREGEFFDTMAQTGHQEHVKRAMEYVNASIQSIASRKDTMDRVLYARDAEVDSAITLRPE